MASQDVDSIGTGSGEETILEVRDASVTFDMERGDSRVLDSVDLDIYRGEILGVVGESGSGKSMFASALLDAIVKPGILSGDITYYPKDGGEVDLLNLTDEQLRRMRWEEIAMVFQGAMSSWNPTMSVEDHFRETLKVHDADVPAGMDRAHQLLADLYLDPERVLDSYPHELSGGMKQRALIALSLVLEPDVLVMDEPTAALDLLMQRSIIALLDNLQREYDLTMVFITHDLELVADLADRLSVMYAFEFVEAGPSEEVLLDSKHPYTRSLVNATPNLETPVDKMQPIPGESPDPVNVPEGCSYHPRCPLADEQCETVDPPFANVSDDQFAACHYWEDVDEEIPLSISEFDIGEQADLADDPGTAGPTPGGAGSASDEPVIALDDVEVHFEQSSSFFDFFSDSEVVQAVDGVDLEIGTNDVVALVGESGCGKTTLGKTAIGLQRPTGGSVKYRGEQDIWEAKDKEGDVTIPHAQIRRSLQIIHQDPGSSLNPNKPVKSILSTPMETWEPDMNVEDRQARIYGMLERVGMKPADDYANRYPHQLSGGEKQRVALIRALLMNPDLILADEAVSALDVSLRVDMMDLLLELQDQFDTSFLFISHNLSNARYLTEKTDGRIGIMYLGRIIEIGSADEVLKNPQHPYTKVLMWATPDLDPASEDISDPPVRKIDIPDATNPPSGCRFHTRCPEAREVCRQRSPTLDESQVEGSQQAACFRAYGADHEYWDSPSIVGDDTVSLSDIESGDSPPQSADD
jgi:peptide/nickel transport system ATP-binding protein